MALNQFLWLNFKFSVQTQALFVFLILTICLLPYFSISLQLSCLTLNFTHCLLENLSFNMYFFFVEFLLYSNCLSIFFYWPPWKQFVPILCVNGILLFRIYYSNGWVRVLYLDGIQNALRSKIHSISAILIFHLFPQRSIYK